MKQNQDSINCNSVFLPSHRPRPFKIIETHGTSRRPRHRHIAVPLPFEKTNHSKPQTQSLKDEQTVTVNKNTKRQNHQITHEENKLPPSKRLKNTNMNGTTTTSWKQPNQRIDAMKCASQTELSHQKQKNWKNYNLNLSKCSVGTQVSEKHFSSQINNHEHQ